MYSSKLQKQSSDFLLFGKYSYKPAHLYYGMREVVVVVNGGGGDGQELL